MSNQETNRQSIGISYKNVIAILFAMILVALNVFVILLDAPVAAIVFTVAASLGVLVVVFRKLSLSDEKLRTFLIAVLFFIAIILCLVFLPKAVDKVDTTDLQNQITALSDANANLIAENSKLTKSNDELMVSNQKLINENAELKEENKFVVPADVRCPNCWGNTTKEGCTHKGNEKSVVAPKPAIVKAPTPTVKPEVKPTVKPTATPTPTVKPVKKDKIAPTVKVTSNKKTIRVGQEATLNVVIKDNKAIDSVKSIDNISIKNISDASFRKSIRKDGFIPSVGYDDDSSRNYSAELIYKFKKPGTYKIYLPAGFAKDEAGNKSSKSNVVTITVKAIDNNAPVVTLKPSTTVLEAGQSVEFNVSVLEDEELVFIDNIAKSFNVSTYSSIVTDFDKNASGLCTNSNYTSYSANFKYKFNDKGTYFVYIPEGFAKDKSGNISKVAMVVITVVGKPVVTPTYYPTYYPSYPTSTPTPVPTTAPTVTPTPVPTSTPTPVPTTAPTVTPTPVPTSTPTPVPTTTPTVTPTPVPTTTPTSTTSMPTVTLTTNDTVFKVGKTITVTATAWDSKALKSFAITAANISGTANGMTIGNGTLSLTQTDKVSYTFPVTLTKTGTYYLVADAGLAINSDGRTSAASEKLQITIETDQVASGDSQMNPVVNDIERPVITVSSFEGFTGDTFDLTGTISDNSGSFVVSSDSIQFTLSPGLTLVSKPVINGNTYTVKLKAETEGSYTVTVKAGAVKDATGNSSIESAPGTVIIKPVFMAPTTTAETTVTDSKVETAASTDTSNSVVSSTDSTVTTTTSTTTTSSSTTTVDSSSTTTSTVPQVQAPTQPAPDNIVWE